MASHSLVARGVLQAPDCHGRPVCDPVPVCPACGGLECLCRPRFFAGQLLTEDDLNLLDRYLQGKNRLHNRHLHGWGVVCGLEVVCGVCGPNLGDVVVKPGYALSPCGNDIIVCKPEIVDICDLINRCRPPIDDCRDPFIPPRHDQPPAPSPHDDAVPANAAGVPAPKDHQAVPPECPAGEEQWVLAVCYVEKPSRGMAALHAGVETACDCHRTAGDCGCGCGCGSKGHHAHGSHGSDHSHGGCGCGCGDKGKAKRGPTKHVPETCEPTVICEGYRFVVYKAPKPPRDRERVYGAAARRFICCLLPFLEQLDAAKPGATPAEAAAWVESFYETVYQFVVDEGLYDCAIAQKLAAIALPSVAGQPANDAIAKLNQATAAIAAIAYLVLQKCFCAAILPPCPEPAFSDCVPLATITVSRAECRVKRVCNISARKFLVTIPNIAYWLSFITDGSGTRLREILERFCCTTDERITALFANAQFFKTHEQEEDVAGAPAPAAVKANRAVFSTMLWRAMTEREREAGPEHILLGALDARDAQGRRFATDQELANPSELIVANKIVAPFMRSFVPEAGLTAAMMSAMGAEGTRDTRVDDLEREIADLRRTVTEQGNTIKTLKRKR